MKENVKKVCIMASLMIFILLLIGCAKQEEVFKEEITIKKGAYITLGEENKRIYSFNENSMYEEVALERNIYAYNQESSNYIYGEDNDIFIKYKDKDILIEDKNPQALKISNDGEYIFYFINEGFLQPVIIDLKGNNKILLENQAIISGKYIEWISDDKLVYYGVRSKDKKAGIFLYDIKSKKEELMYEVTKGYISFLKVINNNVIFIEDNMENKKMLISINEDGIVSTISDSIVDIKDVAMVEGKIYVLGKIKNNAFSIYELLDDKLRRVVYDFPLMINMDKGLSVTDNGELLFMGSNDDYNEQNIYGYKDGSVRLISSKPGKYSFININ